MALVALWFTLPLGALALGLAACGSTHLRYGIEAGEWAALNRTEAEFLGPYDSGLGGSFTDQVLNQGTRVRLYRAPEVDLGFCSDQWRYGVRGSPFAAVLPEGIGIFTDPAAVVGVSLGLRAERFVWRDLGRQWRGGIGLGLQADWVKIRARSPLIDLTHETTVISLPVTLALRHPLWGGEVEIWVRQSWAQGGSQGQALGIGFRQAY
ncbi:hypothetical protein NX862_03205 [Rhodobacter sp. KR11]|uniref:hypothetical protein n=1 Tax=Rhodobacter sp. KR11 TaxID=2974588 RepID=UPI002223003E|nr:hypothetical protein [Rhodobacter sp. KR11]MCW1917748.1 hypothetical protein [Rhodobacter sp. KR11]